MTRQGNLWAEMRKTCPLPLSVTLHLPVTKFSLAEGGKGREAERSGQPSPRRRPFPVEGLQPAGPPAPERGKRAG